MTVAVILYPIAAIVLLIVMGFVVQYALESWSERQTVSQENTNLNFGTLLVQHEAMIARQRFDSSEDTGVIRVRDMARVFAEQDAEIGRTYVESLKQRLILTGTYS